MKAIQASNIRFSYSKIPVVKGVSLYIEKGEFVSILGPNGSGKSTLLKTLSHVYVPDSGDILLQGEPIENFKRKDIARLVAMVPQDTSMDFEFTVEEVVLMGRHPFMGRFKKESSTDLDLVYEAMDRTNTLEIKDRLITEISGGERQRVFIAKALAQNTQIMLLDEPTSHLDINHQIEVLELLRRLNSEKELAIVLVIHDINLAARYSDRILIMKDGEIIAQGRPEDAITPENIDKTYGMSVAVEKNRYTDHISVTPLEIRRRLKAANVRKIHIIGGGGTGQELINKLYQDGHSLSLGVINVGDSDWQHAKSLRISVVEEKPFSGISEKASKKAMEKMLSSDVIVISETPIGSGNVANLKHAKKALEEGVKVLKLCRDPQKEFDFTGGEGREILDFMRSMGLREFADLDSLLEEIDKI